MLREGDELLRLIINSIRSDLVGKQDNAVSLALHAICNVGGKEFAEAHGATWRVEARVGAAGELRTKRLRRGSCESC